MMQRQCKTLKIPGWKDDGSILDISKKFLNKTETGIRCAALLTLWITTCALGTQSFLFTCDTFMEIIRKNKLMGTKERKKDNVVSTRRKTIKPIELKGHQIFYDRSGRTEPILGGAGFAIFNNGNEIKSGFETIPLGTNNIGEFLGCLCGMEAAKGISKEIEMVGDCKILTEAGTKVNPIKNVTLNSILIAI